jgi:hypothetical protein
VSDARAAFAEIDNLLQLARDSTALAKQSATEIVKRALREAEEIKKNAESTDSMFTPSLLDISTPTRSSPSNSVPMPGATSLSPTYNLGSSSPSVGKPQVVDVSQVTARPPVGTSEKRALMPESKGASDNRPPTTDSKKQSPLKLEIGDRVKHDKYGFGTVTAQDGAGPRATATIDFGDKGAVKLMLIAGVPLTKSDKSEDSEPPF